jgi:polyvinyl alcohol dehydrogenase (cytochrome)
VFSIFSSRKKALRLVVVGLAMVAIMLQVAASPAQPGWSMAGQNLSNWRFQPFESKIDKKNVNKLTPQWVFTTAGDVSATPSVSDGAVYFPDWGGYLYKLNRKTGAVIWKVFLSDLTGIPGTVSRTTPTLAEDNTVLVGTQRGGFEMAFNIDTGALLWMTQLDPHPYAIVSQSSVVFKGVVYVGVASSEEAIAGLVPGYTCCTFRGSISALNVSTGQVLWKTYTTLNNNGDPQQYSGASVWGSTPVIDKKRGSLYITTGNNYNVPQSVKDCQTATPNAVCDDPQNYVDAVLSLDLATGQVKWATKLEGYDAWNVACFFAGINCPTPAGPDFDFGQGAMLIPTKINKQSVDVLAAGQKSGVFWGINPDTGAVLWSTQAGPGGTLGGLEWGSATDGNRIYYAIAYNGGIPYQLLNGQTTNGGLWGAINPATGALIWQTADPNGIANNGIDPGAVSVANGVVYAGSLASPASLPTFFALDAATGQIKWQFVSGGSVNSGAAIVNGVVYWGSGYSNFGLGSANNKFYAFGLK